MPFSSEVFRSYRLFFGSYGLNFGSYDINFGSYRFFFGNYFALKPAKISRFRGLETACFSVVFCLIFQSGKKCPFLRKL